MPIYLICCFLCVHEHSHLELLQRYTGYQTCLAAPVTVLAHQHFKTLSKFIAELPKGKQPKVALLTGSTRASDRRKILAQLESGSIDILIGTHALFNQKLEYKNLALVVIDEQHRFVLRICCSI